MMTTQFLGSLSGFSGCQVNLMHDGSSAFVRKIAASPSFNTRLESEVKKLELLHVLAEQSNLFVVPRVRGRGLVDGLAYYDMEYLVGESVEMAVETAAPSLIDSFASRIVEIICLFRSNPIPTLRIAEAERNYLRSKLERTYRGLCTVAQTPGLEKERQCLERNIQALSQEHWPAHPEPSVCHGDLALDNVMVLRSGRLALLDPLVNDFESHRWDWAKVLQSCLVQWGSLKNGNFYLNQQNGHVVIEVPPKMNLFHRRFSELMRNHVHEREIRLYLIVTLARIVPYINTDDQRLALVVIVNRLFDHFYLRKELSHEPFVAMRW